MSEGRMSDPVQPNPSDEPQAADNCEAHGESHHWVSDHVPGLALYWLVSCSLCGQYDVEQSNASLGVSAPTPDHDAEQLAQRFHETYERLAPQFGYKTREASAVPWDEVPEANRRLMIATVREVLAGVGGVPAEPQPEHGLFTEACGGCSSALCVVDGCRKAGPAGRPGVPEDRKQ